MRSAPTAYLCFGIWLLTTVNPGEAAPPSLVADVRPGVAAEARFGSAYHPQRFVALGGVAYFARFDAVGGTELWRSDGTAAGTFRLADLCPGACDAEPAELTVAGGRLFFVADDGSHGREPWVSDGTTAGTRLLRDVTPGRDGSAADWLTADVGRIHFAAQQPDGTAELWTSDGSSAGTVRVASFAPIVEPLRLEILAATTGLLYFSLGNSYEGPELYRSDGTAAGTFRVRDLQPGPVGSLPALTTYVRDRQEPSTVETLLPDGRLLFAADDGSAGEELWVSDGTAAGTVPLGDLAPGPSSSGPRGFVAVGTAVFFTATDAAAGTELWKTDGTPGGTVRVRDLRPGPEPSLPFNLRRLGDRLFFGADDGSHGVELWVSDGTAAGTALVADLHPASGAPFGHITALQAFGTQLVFWADDGTSGAEPWLSDGTLAGTVRLADLAPGPGSSFDARANPRPLRLGDRLLFAANVPPWGPSLWRSDGSGPGTVLVDDPRRPAAGLVQSFAHPPWLGSSTGYWLAGYRGAPAVGEAVAGKLLFPADDGSTGLELWASEGTPAGTGLLADLEPGPAASAPHSLARAGAQVFFLAGPATPSFDARLWVSDGSAAGTLRLAPPSPDGFFAESELTPWGAQLVFAATNLDRNIGQELWASDGTLAGTGLLADLNPFGDPDDSIPQHLTALPSGVYFSATASELAGREVGVTLGTLASSRMRTDLHPEEEEGLLPSSFAELDGVVYFAGYDGFSLPPSGYELWRLDASVPAGARLLRDLRPGPEHGLCSYPASLDARFERQIITVGSRLLLIADDGVSGREPWTSDGTTAGTQLLADLQAGPVGSSPELLVSNGSLALFAADDGPHGRELWVSDGTVAGTRLLVDLNPGPASSVPRDLVALGARFYWSAYVPGLGREAWSSDGTVAGTRLLGDLAPGEASSSPAGFATFAGHIAFAADDGSHGRELWLASPPDVFADGFESGTLEAWAVVVP